MDLSSIESWLLGTIPGVLLLSTFGSILGGILIKTVRWIVGRLTPAWKNAILAAMYRYGRQIEMGERLQKQYAPDDPASTYLLFALTSWVDSLFSAILGALALAGTAGIAVLYGLDRPILLVTSLSITILLLSQFLKSALFALSLTETKITAALQELDKRHPKRFQDRLAKNQEQNR